MPRSFARAATSMWRDQEFRSLDAMAQRTFMMLWTQDDISACGLLNITLGRWGTNASDTDAATVRKDLERLAAVTKPYVIVDETTDELLVRSFIRWDGGYTNPKRLPVILEALSQVHSATLHYAVVQELQRLGVDPSDPRPPSRVDTKPQGNTLFDLEADTLSDSVRVRDARSTTHNPQPTTHNPPSLRSGGAGGLTDANPSATVGRSSSQPAGAVGKRGSGPGTRVPEGFTPSESLREWARRDAPHCGPRDHESFMDYFRGAPGAKGVKRDWDATWRNWMRRAEDDHIARGTSGRIGQVNGHRLSTTDTRVEAALQVGRDVAEQIRRDTAMPETRAVGQ